MLTLLIVGALTVMFLMAQEFIRRMGLPFLWGVFGLLPLALTSYWMHTNEIDLFLWIKIYSVMFCVCWGSWLRFTSHGKRTWFLRTIALLLAANILEATVVDLMAKGIAHGLNALSGGLLVLTMPYGASRSRIDNTSRNCDLRFNVSLPWIIGYTIWNWTFVYLNYTSFSGYHAAILAAALIVAIADPERWLQTRAATLGLVLLPMATCPEGMLSVIDSTSWFEANTAIFAATAVVGWMLVHLVVHLTDNTCVLRNIGSEVNRSSGTLTQRLG